MTTDRGSRWLFLAAAVATAVAVGVPARTADACRPMPPRDSYSLEVIVDGAPLDMTYHRGRGYIEGQRGCRYAIRVRNHTARRVEVVVSVDGLDVVDGQPADYRTKRGYLLGPYESYDIEGFRTSHAEVATFRFSDIGDSYAARRGHPRNVGVIGAAFFPERERPVVYRPRPVPWFGRGDAPDGDWSGATEADDAPAAPAAGKTAEMGGAGLLGETRRPASRQRIGTEYGEARSSGVVEVSFDRASATRPAKIFAVYYDDAPGLRAKGVPIDEPWCGTPDGPFAPTPPPTRPFAPPPVWWDR